MNLASWFDPPPTATGETLALVRIEIKKFGYEDDKNIEYYFKSEKWESIQDRPDLGLREYTKQRRSDKDWLYFTYEPLAPNIKTPRGGRFIFVCNGTSREKSQDICISNYQLSRGPFVTFVLGRPLLPRWKEVQAEVIKLVNSFVVQ